MRTFNLKAMTHIACGLMIHVAVILCASEKSIANECAKEPAFCNAVNDSFEGIPFIQYDVKNVSVNALFSKKIKNRIILKINDFFIDFGPHIPMKVLAIKPQEIFAVFYRPLFENGFKFCIVNLKDREIYRVNLPEKFSKEGYFRQGCYDGNSLYFINYLGKHFNDSLAPDPEGDLNVVYRINFYKKKKPVFDHKWVFIMTRDLDIRFGIDRKIWMYKMDDKSIILASNNIMERVYTALNQKSEITFLPDGFAFTDMNQDNMDIKALIAHKKQGYKVYDAKKHKILSTVEGIAFNLSLKNGGEVYELLNTQNREDYLKFCIESGKDSGFLESGVNNKYARIPWSQVYYLNLFIDITTGIFNEAFSYVSDSFKKEIATRLLFEVGMLDDFLKAGVKAIETGRYSTQTQPRIYAVQSGRILRLLKRFEQYHYALPSLPRFLKETENLAHHEEVFYLVEDNDRDGLPKGRVVLKWPYGVDFPFDGFNIPFNHQDDWASGVAYGGNKNTVAKEIILTLIEKSEIRHSSPSQPKWRYWYGRVMKPWEVKDQLSKNTPQHYGDKSFADISYLTIDASAFLTVSKSFPEVFDKEIYKNMKNFLMQGDLFPFLQADFIEMYNDVINVNKKSARSYLLCDSAWCLQNVGWALKDVKN